jgi:hypothetical protein
VAVTHDSLKLTRSVRFHLQVGDQQRVASVVPDPSGNALVPTVATEVRWWVELLGDKDAVLIVLGSQSQPLVDSAIAPPQPPPVPLVEATMPPAVGQSPASAPAWLRPTGIGLGAGAAVAGGIGAYFAVTSTSARSQLTNATRDGTGAITSLTQVQAAAADQRARDSAVIANTLFVAAGGLLGLGVVLFLVGGHDDVAVTPTGTGVTVSGRF